MEVKVEKKKAWPEFSSAAMFSKDEKSVGFVCTEKDKNQGPSLNWYDLETLEFQKKDPVGFCGLYLDDKTNHEAIVKGWAALLGNQAEESGVFPLIMEYHSQCAVKTSDISFVLDPVLPQMIGTDDKLNVIAEHSAKINRRKLTGACAGAWMREGEIVLVNRRSVGFYKSGGEKINNLTENSLVFLDSSTLKPTREVNLDKKLGYSKDKSHTRFAWHWCWANWFHAKDLFLISHGDNKILSLAEGETGQVVQKCSNFTSCITAHAISRDETEIAVATMNEVVLLESDTLKTKKRIAYLPGIFGSWFCKGAEKAICFIKYSPDNRYIYCTTRDVNSYSGDKKVIIIDLIEGNTRVMGDWDDLSIAATCNNGNRDFRVNFNGQVERVSSSGYQITGHSFEPSFSEALKECTTGIDEKRYYTDGERHAFSLTYLKGNNERNRLIILDPDEPGKFAIHKFNDVIWDMIFVPGKKEFFNLDSFCHKIGMHHFSYEDNTLKKLSEFKLKAEGLRFCPPDLYCTYCDKELTVLFDILKQKEVCRLSLEDGAQVSFFHPESKKAVINNRDGGGWQIIDIDSPNPVVHLDGINEGGTTSVISRNRRFVAIQAYKGDNWDPGELSWLRVYDLETGVQINALNKNKIGDKGMAIRPFTKVFAITDDGDLYLESNSDDDEGQKLGDLIVQLSNGDGPGTGKSGFARFAENVLTDDDAQNDQILCQSLKGLGLKCSAEETQWVGQSLSKGYNLAKAGRFWDSPVAGEGSAKITAIRGEQWKLVMVWGGFETVVRALTGNKTDSKAIEGLLNKCGLPVMKTIQGANIKRKSLERWLEYEPSKGKEAVLGYLGLEYKGVLQAAKKWFVEGKDVETWIQAVELARAIRHATVHGALSANKVNEWGVTDVCLKLSEVLWQIINSIFDQISDSMDN